MGKRKRGVITTLNPDAFAGIYADIAAEIDCETAIKLYEMLRGQMIVFPQKLYSPEYVRAFIREHHEEMTVREISKTFGYSDRRIRQLIAEEIQQKGTQK